VVRFSETSTPALFLTHPPIRWIPGIFFFPGVEGVEAWSYPVTSIWCQEVKIECNWNVTSPRNDNGYVFSYLYPLSATYATNLSCFDHPNGLRYFIPTRGSLFRWHNVVQRSSEGSKRQPVSAGRVQSLWLNEYLLQATHCANSQSKIYCEGLYPVLRNFSEHLTCVKVNNIGSLHAIEGVWVSRGVNPLILNVGTRWWWTFRFTPRRKHHKEAEWAQQSWSGRFVDEESPLFLTGNPTTICWFSSHYTYVLSRSPHFTWAVLSWPTELSATSLSAGPFSVYGAAVWRRCLADRRTGHIWRTEKFVSACDMCIPECGIKCDRNFDVDSWVLFHGCDSCGLWHRVTW
jgi:hypothetical protein